MVSTISPIFLTELSEKFPGLIISEVDPALVLIGDFELAHEGAVFDSYDVRIEVESFPDAEPKVFEQGGRVKLGQHLNPDGTCCTGVFEVWRAEHPADSLCDFLQGPVRNFFVGHREVEAGRKWPFGELSHGFRGIVEAAAELLGVAVSDTAVVGYLRFLSRKPKERHRRCACGSGNYLRDCHGDDLRLLHKNIRPAEARSILRRLLKSRRAESSPRTKKKR